MNSQTILITGCSTGIGLDCALKLLKEGYQVIATARTEQGVTTLQEQGMNAVYMDLADEKSVEQGFKQALQISGGQLDYLFNNAAYGQPGAIEDLPTHALRDQFEVNFFAWHHLTQLALKVMREQGHGRIIFNSSVLGFVCMPYRGAYNASKYALEGLVDTLRLELVGSPIKVSIIQPGPINTHFRINAALAFKKNIQVDKSYHQVNYTSQLKRLESNEAPSGFTLQPAAVTKCLLHALQSKRPKLRYKVTFPTKLFSLLKRVLPDRWLDYLLAKG
jgi:NAD(P)-dependent dehydrogenase (short-subunit alcohol dehydrogenase family)